MAGRLERPVSHVVVLIRFAKPMLLEFIKMYKYFLNYSSEYPAVTQPFFVHQMAHLLMDSS